jgi:hypothetical protein
VIVHWLDTRGDQLPEDVPMYGYGSAYAPLTKEQLNFWLGILKANTEDDKVPFLDVSDSKFLPRQ